MVYYSTLRIYQGLFSVSMLEKEPLQNISDNILYFIGKEKEYGYLYICKL
jgi:hypothetical protein